MLPPMSTLYTVYMAAQAEHNQAMLVLTLIALAVAALWVAVSSIPSTYYRSMARWGYIALVVTLCVIGGNQ